MVLSYLYISSDKVTSFGDTDSLTNVNKQERLLL